MAKNLELKELVKTYARVFNSPAGQDVLDDLEKRYFGKKRAHVPGDPYTSAYHEGQRSVTLFIKSCLELASDSKRLDAATQTSYAADEGEIE